MIPLSGAENDHGFPFRRHHALIFQPFQHTAHHFPGATDDTADLLAGDANLHAIGVSHGIGLFAQVQQGAGHAAGDIQKGKVAHLAGGYLQALGDLAADFEQDFWDLPRDLTGSLVTNFGDLTVGASANPGGALGVDIVQKQAQLTEKISPVEIGDDNFSTFVVFYKYCDRAVYDVVKRIGRISRADDVGTGPVVMDVTVFKKTLCTLFSSTGMCRVRTTINDIPFVLELLSSVSFDDYVTLCSFSARESRVIV